MGCACKHFCIYTVKLSVSNWFCKFSAIFIILANAIDTIDNVIDDKRGTTDYPIDIEHFLMGQLPITDDTPC